MLSTPIPGPGAVITPEAVWLELPLAQLGSRTLALLLDWGIQAFLGVSLLLSVAVAGEVSGGVVPAWVFVTAGILLSFAVWVGYPVVLETAWGGRTLGKAALGLRVVTVEGAPVGFRHACIRAAFTLVDLYGTAGAVAVISVLVTRRQQRLGDLVAGTIVVRERSGAPRPVPVRFGASGTAPAAGLDVTGLSARDYEVIRTFLLRAPSLPAQARERLARQVADAVAPRAGHRLPPGLSAEAFLAAAAAGYQQRGAAEPHRFDGAPPRGQGPSTTPSLAEPGPRATGTAPPSGSGEPGFVPPA